MITVLTKDPKKLEIIYWFDFPEWYTSENIDGEIVYKLKPNAPERIRKSFEAWDNQKDE